MSCQLSLAVDIITQEHVPRTVDDLFNLPTATAASAATELSELAGIMQELTSKTSQPTLSIRVQHDARVLTNRCTQLASVCQDEKARAPGSGWESPAWQECKIFSHLCAPTSQISFLTYTSPDRSQRL